MFSTSISPSKWVTDPALEAGTLAASPITKMFGAALDCSVCSSVGTKFKLVAETQATAPHTAAPRAAGRPRPGQNPPRGRRRR